MVLYYGLFALETANKTVAKTTSTSQRESFLKKPMTSSSNSWIYTEDLKKRYADYRYILIPIYIDGKKSRYIYSSTAIIPQRCEGENSWMYSRSIRNHLFNSTSSVCCITNQGFIRDELPIKKKVLQQSLITKNKSTNNIIEEDDDENQSTPLIKQKCAPSTTVLSKNSNELVTPSTNNNKLTRLRSFFFKSSSSLSSTH